jgi:hypothetical protein
LLTDAASVALLLIVGICSDSWPASVGAAAEGLGVSVPIDVAASAKRDVAGMDKPAKSGALAEKLSSADQAGTLHTNMVTPTARISCLNQRGEPMIAPFVSIVTTSGNAHLRSTWSWIDPDQNPTPIMV